MTGIMAAELPRNSLLGRYARLANGDDTGHYTDCFVADVPASIDLAQFVFAFYTTPLFRLERGLLRLFAASPSTDEGARAIAAGERDSFAAWVVEQRVPGQILLRDLTGRTRSWFMVSTQDMAAQAATRLHFGSAVLLRSRASGKPRRGMPFSLLIALHRFYSRALLWSACRRVAVQSRRR